MKEKTIFLMAATIFVFAIFFAMSGANAQKPIPDSITLKLEGAKMAPVTFSHANHSKNTDCAVCHHKEKNPREPDKCGTCHQVKGVKEGAPPATDAFHKQCQNCHKESKTKGISAPTACNECHKK